MPQKSTRSTRALVSFLVPFVLLCGCRHESRTPAPTNLTFSYEVSPLPARVGDVTITIKIKDGSNEPVSGARIKLEGNMSHAGMAPVFAEAKEIGPGQYRTNMNLSMAGDWQVLVRLTLADGRELDQQFEIKEVAPA